MLHITVKERNSWGRKYKDTEMQQSILFTKSWFVYQFNLRHSHSTHWFVSRTHKHTEACARFPIPLTSSVSFVFHPHTHSFSLQCINSLLSLSLLRSRDLWISAKPGDGKEKKEKNSVKLGHFRKRISAGSYVERFLSRNNNSSFLVQ